MIINTGQRTDIPAFYSDWLCRRLQEGYVCVRNPYNPQSVTRYRLDPAVVDVIGFCTKNPRPMLDHMDLLAPYGQYWYVTITPYGTDFEPNVPPKEQVLADFRRLSGIVGRNAVGWRYDPIFLNETYTIDRHLREFSAMAAELEGYTDTAVISFIDLYRKVQRNFPEARVLSREDRLLLGGEMVKIAASHGMTLRPCGEGTLLASVGADCSGCMTIAMYEKAIGRSLIVPKSETAKRARAECACYLSCDIGAYNSCGHLCRYCYANENPGLIRANMKLHDPESPFLIGHAEPGDHVHEARQETWADYQLKLF